MTDRRNEPGASSSAWTSQRRARVPPAHRPGKGRNRFRHARAGDQIPTVRQVAVDLSINPNTVVRAYRELEIRGVLETQQGTGTFISHQKVKRDEVERQRRLDQLVGEFVARAGGGGFTVQELLRQ